MQEHLKYQRSLAGKRGSRKPAVTAASGSQLAVTSSPVVSSPHLAPSVSESLQLKDAVCNHTFPVYLISTSLHPRPTLRHTHTDIENEDFRP